jgi:hypothetical protein
MLKPSQALEQALKYRNQARRARRLAPGLSLATDREALIRYGEELDALASGLERQAARPTDLFLTIAVGLGRPTTQPPHCAAMPMNAALPKD